MERGKRKSNVRNARRALVLGASSGLLAFLGGFTSTYLLNENPEASSPTLSTTATLTEGSSSSSEVTNPTVVFADMCGNIDMSATTSACYAAGKKNEYHREWRLWQGIESELESWPLVSCIFAISKRMHIDFVDFSLFEIAAPRFFSCS